MIRELWLFSLFASSPGMRMICKRFMKLSCHFWSLAWRWTQSLTAAGTTAVGSQVACLDQTGPENWPYVIAASAWMIATVSNGKKEMQRSFKGILHFTNIKVAMHLLPMSHTILSLLHQSIAGIIAAWLSRCLVYLWIKSCGLPTVWLAPISPITPAGTIAAHYCHCSTRSLQSHHRHATSLPSPPLHLLHKPILTVSVRSNFSKVISTKTQKNQWLYTAVSNNNRQGAV